MCRVSDVNEEEMVKQSGTDSLISPDWFGGTQVLDV